MTINISIDGEDTPENEESKDAESEDSVAKDSPNIDADEIVTASLAEKIGALEARMSDAVSKIDESLAMAKSAHDRLDGLSQSLWDTQDTVSEIVEDISEEEMSENENENANENVSEDTAKTEETDADETKTDEKEGFTDEKLAEDAKRTKDETPEKRPFWVRSFKELFER